MDREPLSFKIGDRAYFKNKQPGKWDLKWRPAYRIVHIEHDGHYLQIENQATGKTRSCNNKYVVLESPVEFWDIDAQFGRAGKSSTTLQTFQLTIVPSNHHDQQLKMNTLLM